MTTVHNASEAIERVNNLDNVDNTSDIDKPLSTLAQEALDVTAAFRGSSIAGNGEIDLKGFDDTYTFGSVPNTLNIDQNPQYIKGKVITPVSTDVLLDEAPTALVSTDGLAPAGLSKYDFVVTEPQELVTNGMFDTDMSGWAPYNDGILSIVSGQLVLTNAATGVSGAAYQEVPLVIGAEHTFKLKIVEGTSGNSVVRLGTAIGSTNYTGINDAGSGTLTYKFIAVSTSIFITLYTNSTIAGETCLFDDISVQPVDKIFQLTESSYTTSEALLSSAKFTAKESVYREDSIWLRDDATYLAVKGQAVPDGYTEVGGENGLWSDGTNFAVPVTDVVRKRNQGGYHNVFGKSGTVKWRSDANNSTVDFYSSALSPITSVAKCFYPVNTGGAAFPAGSGSISTATSGAPDGLFYDALYSHDLLDRRMGAKGVVDSKRLLDDSMHDLVDGLVRGEDSGVVSTFNYDFVSNSGTQTVNTGEVVFIVAGFQGTGNAATVGYLYERVSTPVTLDIGSETNYLGAAWVALGSCVTATTTRSASSIRRCALIGDPANYYRGRYDFNQDGSTQGITYETGSVIYISDSNPPLAADAGHFFVRLGGGGSGDISTFTFSNNPTFWQDLGPDREDSWLLEGNTLDAEPLLVAEDGSSLIPDGTSKDYKMNHHINSDVLLALYSLDEGNTWGINTVGINGILDTTLNGYNLNTPEGWLYLIVYTSPTTPLIDYETPDSTISEGTAVIASDSSRMVDYVTDKVAVGTSPDEECTVLKRINGVATHTASGLTEGAKLAGALVSLNGQNHIKVSSEEIDTTDDGALDTDAGTYLVPLQSFSSEV